MSSNRRPIDVALEALGAEFGQTLTLDANDVALLEFANDVSCAIEAPTAGGHVYFHAAVLRASRDRREEMLAEALKLNFFRLSLAGAALALDADSDALTYCYSVPAETIDADRLAGVLAAIAQDVGELRGHFADGAKAFAGTNVDSLSMSEFFIRV
jgi:hypothetical protein